MVNNRNAYMMRRAHERLNIRDGIFFDNDMQNKIIPVYEIDKPICSVVKQASAQNGSAIVYTTPTDKDFYLTAFTFSLFKNATSDCATSNIYVTLGGQTCILHLFAGITLTAQDENIHVTLNYPVKIDRGTNIVIANNANSVGTTVISGTVFGYLGDTLGGI